MNCSEAGLTPKSYQENHRISFTLGGACLQIDHWPLIPPYLEIEAHYREEVMRNAGRFDERELTGENTIKIYARYGMDLNTIRERFGEEAEVVWISAIGGVLRPKT